MKMRNKTVVAVVAAFLAVGSIMIPGRASAEEPKPAVQAVGAKQMSWDALDVKVVKEEGDRWTLRIRNRTPFIVIVYIYGRRVGWLRPFRTGQMRGLRRGFHRLYAHSRWGSFYWGPRSVWVPGTWSLYR